MSWRREFQILYYLMIDYLSDYRGRIESGPPEDIIMNTKIHAGKNGAAVLAFKIPNLGTMCFG